jgi:hypothetical protein
LVGAEFLVRGVLQEVEGWVKEYGAKWGSSGMDLYLLGLINAYRKQPKLLLQDLGFKVDLFE